MKHTEKQRIPGSYPAAVILILLCLTALCRGMGYIYSTMATDITYSDLTVSIAGILLDVLTLSRTMAGFAAIVYAMARWERPGMRCGGVITALVLLADALDGFSRYLVDSATSSITDMETVAFLWLAMQFCYSTILNMLCWCTGRILTSREKGASAERILTQTTAYLLVSRVLLEVYYLVDFLTTYTDITRTEVSSIIGQFLYTIVLYGGIAWGLGMGMLWVGGRWFGHREPEKAPDENTVPMAQ